MDYPASLSTNLVPDLAKPGTPSPSGACSKGYTEIATVAAVAAEGGFEPIYEHQDLGQRLAAKKPTLCWKAVTSARMRWGQQGMPSLNFSTHHKPTSDCSDRKRDQRSIRTLRRDGWIRPIPPCVPKTVPP